MYSYRPPGSFGFETEITIYYCSSPIYSRHRHSLIKPDRGRRHDRYISGISRDRATIWHAPIVFKDFLYDKSNFNGDTLSVCAVEKYARKIGLIESKDRFSKRSRIPCRSNQLVCMYVCRKYMTENSNRRKIRLSIALFYLRRSGKFITDKRSE